MEGRVVPYTIIPRAPFAKFALPGPATWGSVALQVLVPKERMLPLGDTPRISLNSHSFYVGTKGSSTKGLDHSAMRVWVTPTSYPVISAELFKKVMRIWNKEQRTVTVGMQGLGLTNYLPLLSVPQTKKALEGSCFQILYK